MTADDRSLPSAPASTPHHGPYAEDQRLARAVVRRLCPRAEHMSDAELDADPICGGWVAPLFRKVRDEVAVPKASEAVHVAPGMVVRSTSLHDKGRRYVVRHTNGVIFEALEPHKGSPREGEVDACSAGMFVLNFEAENGDPLDEGPRSEAPVERKTSFTCARCDAPMSISHVGVRVLTDRIDALLAENEKLRSGASDPLHPYGRCVCAGEGECAWCVASIAAEAAAEIDEQRREAAQPETPAITFDTKDERDAAARLVMAARTSVIDDQSEATRADVGQRLLVLAQEYALTRGPAVAPCSAEVQSPKLCRATTTLERMTYQCFLPAGHDGNHEAGSTEVEWDNATAKPRVLHTDDDRFMAQVATYVDEWRDGDGAWHGVGHIESMVRESLGRERALKELARVTSEPPAPGNGGGVDGAPAKNEGTPGASSGLSAGTTQERSFGQTAHVPAATGAASDDAAGEPVLSPPVLADHDSGESAAFDQRHPNCTKGWRNGVCWIVKSHAPDCAHPTEHRPPEAGPKACDERPENVWSAIVNGVTPGPCPHFPTRLTPCTECESDGPRPCPRCGGQLRYIGKDRWQCDATMCPFYRVNGEPRRPRETTRPKGPWLIRLQTDDRIGAHFLCAIGETPWWSQEHKAMRFPEHSDAFFTGGHLGVPVLIVEAADSVSEERRK